MHIDYEISEQDYTHAGAQMIGPHARDLNAGTLLRVILPVIVLAVIGFSFIYRSLSSTHATPRRFALADVQSLFPGLLFFLPGVLVVFFLWWFRQGPKRVFRQIYRSTPYLRGRFHLEVNEDGMSFTGENFYWKASWPEFRKFFEDRKVFILEQWNPERGTTRPLVSHVLPKRGLAPDQITALRQYLQRSIHKGSRPPQGLSSTHSGH